MRRSLGVGVFALLVGLLAAGTWSIRRHRRVAAPLAEEGAAASPPAPAVPAAWSTPPLPPTQRPRPGTVPAAMPPTDEQLLVGIRAKARSNPEVAESLAREARARFPNSPHADEWDALLVDALVNQQRIGAARSEAYYYYDHHPRGSFAAHLFALTGVHPMPVGPGPH